MASAIMVAFVGGAVASGYMVIGLFFLRFWRRTRDSLFGAFAIAFWLMAANQTAATYLGPSDERQTAVYLLRLAAFGLIIAAIVRKNLRARQGKP
jgi:peptidoglycan/LPS O-acetylase OafA/YrhL